MRLRIAFITLKSAFLRVKNAFPWNPRCKRGLLWGKAVLTGKHSLLACKYTDFVLVLACPLHGFDLNRFFPESCHKHSCYISKFLMNGSRCKSRSKKIRKFMKKVLSGALWPRLVKLGGILRLLIQFSMNRDDLLGSDCEEVNT